MILTDSTNSYNKNAIKSAESFIMMLWMKPLYQFTSTIAQIMQPQNYAETKTGKWSVIRTWWFVHGIMKLFMLIACGAEGGAKRSHKLNQNTKIMLNSNWTLT